ncbi:MAG TPA: GTPase HflX [Abditibacteriaceae bacterium]|jgi:GTP-binding protein HflX
MSNTQENETKEKSQEKITRDADGFISNAPRAERALLAQLITDDSSEEQEHSTLDELAGLCEAAGATVVGEMTQKRPRPDPATFFGKGKVEEIGENLRENNINVLVIDRELSPAQGRNLEKELDVRVIDRTELILDIFARRAQTRQAKLQVELAQLRYQLPRLKRMWTHLDSQAGGGIGLRGPGETQLETDKRLAGDRISLLQKSLDEIRRQKQTESAGRFDWDTAALVGYTNVGKSALLNALSRPTGKGVYEANQLFATLGASTRRLELGGGRAVLLSDTVGFVRRLPHHLVECFHGTLAEVENADVLLRVGSAADPELDDKTRAVDAVLNELKVGEKQSITVLNQVDLISAEDRAALARRFPDAVFTSALTGEGLDELRDRIVAMIDADAKEVSWIVPVSDARSGKLLSDIAQHGTLLAQDWTTDKARITARLRPRWREKLEQTYNLRRASQ